MSDTNDRIWKGDAQALAEKREVYKKSKKTPADRIQYASDCISYIEKYARGNWKSKLFAVRLGLTARLMLMLATFGRKLGSFNSGQLSIISGGYSKLSLTKLGRIKAFRAASIGMTKAAEHGPEHDAGLHAVEVATLARSLRLLDGSSATNLVNAATDIADRISKDRDGDLLPRRQAVRIYKKAAAYFESTGHVNIAKGHRRSAERLAHETDARQQLEQLMR